MRSVNKVILIGNLTRPPELKTTAGGQAIVTFGLATNRQWTTSGSQKRVSAEFHECVAWAKLAEICSTYLKKGMLVYVEGYLKTRSWDMEDGTRRFRTEVVLQDMIILEKRGDQDGEDFAPYEEGAMDFSEEMGNEVSNEPAMEQVAESPKPAPVSTPTPAPAPTMNAPSQVASATPDLDLDDENMF